MWLGGGCGANVSTILDFMLRKYLCHLTTRKYWAIVLSERDQILRGLSSHYYHILRGGELYALPDGVGLFPVLNLQCGPRAVFQFFMYCNMIAS